MTEDGGAVRRPGPPGRHPRLRAWWTDDAANPDRASTTSPTPWPSWSSRSAATAPGDFAWPSVARLVEGYEAAAHARLTPEERKALAPYTAAVPLYAAALDGFTEDSAGKLRGRLPFLHLSEWLLAHPNALLG